MIKKIWTDPVWSKVISVGIIGLISLGYAKFISVTEKITFKDAYKEIFEIKISIVYVLGLVLLYWLLKMIFKKKKTTYNKQQRKLRTFNKTIDQNTGIQFTWGVYFDLDETPFISDLTAFCTKHGEIPIRFIGNSCQFQGCVNSKPINYNIVKNMIESDLIDRWEKLK